MLAAFLYLLALFFLGIYSYSQIDLNLTLFQNPIFLSFQNTMIQLGYFNRPLSTTVFVVLILVLFSIFYFLFSHTKTKQLSRRETVFLIVGIILIGFVSYPAFSHDVFNYLFDAKILTSYGQNPYFFKALDFPNDPWIRFMHWTHRTYPYGPFWLLATAPLTLLGFGKFVLTLSNFKLFFVAIYLINFYLLKKIAVVAKLSNPNLVALTYALNPLVIIESVISPHIDSFMTLLLLLAIYLWVKSQRGLSLLSLLASVLVKFVTVILTPLFLWRKITFSRLIKLSIILLLLALGGVIAQRDPYPWYFLPVLALLSLLPDSPWAFRFSFLLSLGLFLTYAPYLLVGSYPQAILVWEYVLFLGPLILVSIGFISERILKNFRKREVPSKQQ